MANAAVQAAHAAHEAARQGLSPPSIRHPNFVLLGVRNRDALEEAEEYLRSHGIRTVVWTDDLFDNEPTALCTEPLMGGQRRPLRRFSLLKDLSCKRS